ncbi:MAG TPA: SET domain-containing protein-lysine N-methyltransferase [Allosphingosinicella sp.]|nr:SET domain-containing protein-lysine N-methyltransferase [Allosphingosinicella sp.]
MIVQLAIAAAALQALGYVLYARLFLKKAIRPNAASSFMFAYGTGLLVLLEFSDGATWPVLALPATCAALSVGIALLCMRKRATDPVDRVEATAFSADVWLTVLWAAIAFGYGNISPFSAGFLLAGNVTTLTAFFPVLRSTWRTPERERPEPWLVWTAAYSLLTVVTLLADQGRHPALLVYPLLSVALHGSIAVMAIRGRVGLSRWVDAARSIYIGRSAIHGEGMIAGRRFEAGEVVWKMTGTPVFGAVTESGPNYIGLGPGVWLDPDLPLDHINHHCAPNAAFGARRQLVALRPIGPHEEVTLDYSTTEADPAWSMGCGCGAAECRGILYAIQRSFAERAQPPEASPLMQLVWHHRRAAFGASAFPQLPAAAPPRFQPAWSFGRRPPILPASLARRRMLRARRAGGSRLAWRALSQA